MDTMEHQEAMQLAAVDKYLLNEMTPQMRDEFEEHFFDCQECATDLRATAAFMEAAKKELKPRPLVLKAEAAEPKASRFSLRWRPAVQLFALAASLLVIAYQNIAVIPVFRTEIAQLEKPAVVPSLSLVGASRGGSTPSITVGNAKKFVLQVEIPTDDRYSSYECLLYSPTRELLLKQEISSQIAKDTVTLAVPSDKLPAGNYILTVMGKTAPDKDRSATEAASYHFELSQ